MTPLFRHAEHDLQNRYIRSAILSNPQISARPEDRLTRSQISLIDSNVGSSTTRQEGWARKSNTAPFSMAHSTDIPIALRNHSSFQKFERNAFTSLIGLM